MADLADLTKFVRIVAPACPDPIALEMLRGAADELCHKSKVWVEEPDPLDIEDNEPRYKIPIPSDLVPIEVNELRLNGVALDICNVPNWYDGSDAWPQAATGVPTKFAQLTPDTVILDVVPVRPVDITTWQLAFKVCVRPGLDRTTVPSWLMREHYQTIVAGARASVLSLPQFSNPQSAAGERIKFDADITKLQWRVSKGSTRRSSNPAPEYF